MKPISTDICTLTRRDADMIQLAVARTLEEMGAIKKTIGRSEIVQNYSRAIFDEARMDNNINWRKDGNYTSPVYCLRREFEAFLMKKQITIKLPKLN